MFILLNIFVDKIMEFLFKTILLFYCGQKVWLIFFCKIKNFYLFF